MKLAVLSESPADAEAVRILVNGILGEETELPDLPRRQPPGWPAVVNELPAVLKQLHYQTDVDALAVVADSNHSPVHKEGPDGACSAGGKCRLCQLRHAARETLGHLSPVPGRGELRVAVGLAVPAVEAWYLCGVKSGVSEAAWVQGLKSSKLPYSTAQLKRALYDTERPSRPLEAECATREARRLAGDLDLLESRFPVGFGSLAETVRNWNATPG